jgi:hypothetical protein
MQVAALLSFVAALFSEASSAAAERVLFSEESPAAATRAWELWWPVPAPS